MPVVDTLVTKMTLDAGGYNRGAKEVLGATQRVGDKIGGMLKQASGMGAIGGLLSAGTFVALGKSALDNATSFDTLTRSLTAVTKSGERAKSILSFADQLALPSIFGSEDLARAATTLEAFGLKTERFLPIAEKLGTVFGGTKESLDQFVRSLGFIKGGRFGEGFESLAAAGISKSDLTLKYGLKFDKGGEFKGDVDQALNAIEKAVNDRFGNLSKEMASGPAAAMASFGDVTNRVSRQVGKSLLTIAVPAITVLSDKLGAIVKSGTVQQIADGFASLVSGKDIGTFLAKGLDGAIGILKEAPAWIQKNKDAFKSMFDAAKNIGSIIARDAVPVLKSMFETVNRLVSAFNALPDGLKTVLVTLGVANKVSGGLLGSVGGMIGGMKTGGADPSATLGGLLLKTITGPIGLIGSVLIAGAVGLADAASKGIKVLEGRKEDRAAVPLWRFELDEKGNRIPIAGKPGHFKKHELTAEEKEAEYKKLRKQRALKDLGLDPNDFPTDPPPATPTTEPTPTQPVYQSVLEKIATNTGIMADSMQTVLSGGSTNARNVTSEYGRYQTMRGKGHSEVKRLLGELGDMLDAIVGSQDVLNQRARMA